MNAGNDGDAGANGEVVQPENDTISPAPSAPESSSVDQNIDALGVGMLVDPEISRKKFLKEVASFRRMEREYTRRGWFMIRAEYPEIVVVFAAPHLKPRAVIVGVSLDFQNYDLWPPSVRFVDPFSLEPLLQAQMPLQLYQRPPTPKSDNPADLFRPDGAEALPSTPPQAVPVPEAGYVQIALAQPPQPLIMWQSDGKPFLCVAGVREYHNHPFHTNNPWLAHRGTTRGTLLHILDVIHKYGIVPLKEFAVSIQVIIGQPVPDVNQIPE